MCHLVFTYWRVKSYIPVWEILVLENLAINVHWSFCCYCLILWLLLFNCNCGCTIADQQQKNETVSTTAIRTKRLSNLCRLIFVLLLLLCNLFLFNCNCGCTMTDEQQQQQQNYTVTTTLRTKRLIYIHILYNFQELNWGGRLQSDISCSDVPPSTSIWWPRGVLCKVIMTLGYSLSQTDIQSDLPPSRGIWWPRAVQSWKVWWVQFLLICCSPVGEVSHTLQCRRYELLKIEPFM